MMAKSVESICVFGSAARGTTDELSDRDILIITSEPCRRRELTKKWVSVGWSVAAYHPNRLRAMVRKGSLFVQHIKREGIIISDNGGWLEKLLKKATPKQSYEADFLLANNMLKPLERLAIGYWSQLMAADLAFVYVRNAGIYALAERGVYEFGYDRILRGLAGVVGLTDADVMILQRLRTLKVAYRLRDHSLADLGEHSALLKVCSKVAGTCIASTIPEVAPIRLFPSRYASLRDVEARLISQFNVEMLDKGRLGDDISSLWRVVTNPREYSWTIHKIDPEWIANANQILAKQACRERLASRTLLPSQAIPLA